MPSLAQHFLAGGDGSAQLAQPFADTAIELPFSLSPAKAAKNDSLFSHGLFLFYFPDPQSQHKGSVDVDTGLNSLWVSLAAIRTSSDELTPCLTGAGTSQCSHLVK